MSKKLIILEDDPFLKEFYKFVFRKTDFVPVITEDGDEFAMMLKENDIALILMDINLRNTYLEGEKIDGVQLSRYVKKNADTSHIPVILVSAYNLEKANGDLFKESLADDYFTKPIGDINFFLNKLGSLADQSCLKVES